MVHKEKNPRRQRLSSISISWRKRSEADSPSCHLTGVTFDVRMAADPSAVSVTGEAVQPSGLGKQEPLKGHVALAPDSRSIQLFRVTLYNFHINIEYFDNQVPDVIKVQISEESSLISVTPHVEYRMGSHSLLGVKAESENFGGIKELMKAFTISIATQADCPPTMCQSLNTGKQLFQSSQRSLSCLVLNGNLLLNLKMLL
ncbi:hypothetical protein Nmel_004440 [Mimus melanotis]